jgi:hypothetical protein
MTTETTNNVISPTSKKSGKGMGSVADGTIGSVIVEAEDVAKPKVTNRTSGSDSEKVAVYSTRNVSWQDVGVLSKGYNILTKEKADIWLKRDHVRLATPEELAKEFDK